MWNSRWSTYHFASASGLGEAIAVCSSPLNISWIVSRTDSLYDAPMRFAFLLAILSFGASAQQTMPEPPNNDNTGFDLIFDGKTLNGWDGDPKYWRVENGAIVGEITPETIVKQNTFLIW